MGCRVIASTRTGEKKEFLKRLGPDEVIVTEQENTLGRLQEISGEKGIKFVFDPIGTTAFNQQYIGALLFGGSAAIYGLLGGEFPSFPLLDLVRNNTTLYAYSMFNHVMDKSQLDEGVSYVLNQIKKTGLTPLVDKVFDFNDTVEAYKYMLSNKQKGKIVVKVNN
ncbi:zinc-binding dehydrogenase [Flagellimonas sp. CMM7]|nr:zinc-binding dehydrogenase [Flagellimonas sp. CMM7]